MVSDGIDVSQYQGNIDWEKVKNHIDFVIIRCGYGQDLVNQDDKMFKRNADECTRLNIPFGVYLYSYAQNEQDAIKEAEHCIRLIKDYKLDYPIYYDLEDPKIGRLNNEQIVKNIIAFCNKLEENNYFPGIYANLYWWKTKLNSNELDKYTKWIAYYSDELENNGVYDMWQYSQTGFVEGIESYVDLDYCYRDFPNEIRNGGYNNFNKVLIDKVEYKVGDRVSFNHVYISSDSTVPLIPYMNEGNITKIQKGARNPYLIGNGLGWVNNESINNIIRYLSNPSYKEDSIVNALVEIGIDASFENRKRIAQLNGINNYQGSSRQNNELLNLLKIGKLIY
jgi:GH25 family lysozyme M1 (1,4-beta-N-acetylmuramidase)